MGPLHGLKIIELSGMGPAPFCGMMLADMGAEVVCIERNDQHPLEPASDCTRRGKRSIRLDLKSADGRETFFRLLQKADAVFEGYRPGVMENLGLGPDTCMALNPRLVFGRMTGWGQTGPLAKAAGHDINYISLTGALHAIGYSDRKPVPPLSLVGDFGGGATFLAFGIVCALLEAQRTGKGQVVDAAMTDGSALLMAVFHSLDEQGRWNPRRGSNLLDGGAPFYDVYETSDEKFVSIGSIEPQFYALLLDKLGLSKTEFGPQDKPQLWPEQKRKLEALFKTRSRQAWCDLMEGSDVCFAPVLDIREAPGHPQNRARETYVEIGGMIQPAPAPRFSRTRAELPSAAHEPGSDLEAVLHDWLDQ